MYTSPCCETPPPPFAATPIAMHRRGIQARSRSQAVIGAGAAGLVAARELIREGHAVTVFEQVPDGCLRHS